MRRSRLLLWAAVVAALALCDRLLKLHYYGRVYRYYEAGEVYWEDSQTLLLFGPDRHLFWRLKPHIRMHLAETPARYSLYWSEPRPTSYAFTLRTDSRGLNTPEFDCRKPEGTYRIVALGDSRTMAEGVDSPYPRRLEALLGGRGGRRFEVVNAGISGYSSYQGRVLLERELLECRPDAVTLLFGINDQDTDQGVSDVEKARYFDSPIVTLRQWANRSMLAYLLRRQAWQLKGTLLGKTRVEPVVYGPERTVRRVSPQEYEANLRRVVELGRRHGFRTILLIVPASPYLYEPSLHTDVGSVAPDVRQALEDARALLVRGADAEATGRLHALASSPDAPSEAHYLLAERLRDLGRFDEAQREFLAASRSVVFASYEAVVHRVGAEPGATLVDLTPEFTQPRREPPYLDDMHPNELGHELIARRLAEAVVSGGP